MRTYLLVCFLHADMPTVGICWGMHMPCIGYRVFKNFPFEIKDHIVLYQEFIFFLYYELLVVHML